MKRFFVLLLALAMLSVLAACGTSPVQGGEGTEPETTMDALTQEETSAFTFPFPDLPSITQLTQEDTSAVSAMASQPIVTIATATAKTNAPTVTATIALTTKPTAATKATTATTTTTTTRPTTTTTTTIATTTTTTTTQGQPAKVTKGTFSVSVAKAKAAGSAVTISVTTVNQVGTAKDRVYTGVKLKDFLAAQNVDVAALSSSATLMAKADDGETLTYTYSDIISDKTLLAWDDAGEPLSPPRLCPCGATDASKYLRGVESITLS